MVLHWTVLHITLQGSLRCKQEHWLLGLPHLTALPEASNKAGARSEPMGRAVEGTKGLRDVYHTVQKEKGTGSSSISASVESISLVGSSCIVCIMLANLF